MQTKTHTHTHTFSLLGSHTLSIPTSLGTLGPVRMALVPKKGNSGIEPISSTRHTHTLLLHPPHPLDIFVKVSAGAIQAFRASEPSYGHVELDVFGMVAWSLRLGDDAASVAVHGWKGGSVTV